MRLTVANTHVLRLVIRHRTRNVNDPIGGICVPDS
jgi:hypothetical protein